MRVEENLAPAAPQANPQAPAAAQAAKEREKQQDGQTGKAHSAMDKELMAAAAEGKAGRVAEALAKGANVNVVDERGWTPLMMAAWDGYERCVAILLDAGADQAARQEHGLTAAKLAEAIGEPKVLALLEAQALAGISVQKLRREKDYVREPARMPEQPSKPWAERQAEAKKSGYQGARPPRKEGEGHQGQKPTGYQGSKPAHRAAGPAPEAKQAPRGPRR